MSDTEERLEAAEAPETEEIEGLDDFEDEFGPIDDDDGWKKGLLAVGVIVAVGFLGGILTGIGIGKNKAKKEEAE